MTDSTSPRREDRIDRYVRGELTAAEARELAHESLDNPELFEDLTCSALAMRAVSAGSAGRRLERPGPSERMVRLTRNTPVILAGVAAALIVLVSLYSLRSSLLRPILSQNQPHENSPDSALSPALPLSAKPGQPILLASVESAPARRDGAPVFRGAEPRSRVPRPAGSITSVDGEAATIDLGSLDGLVKGTELAVFRDERFTQPIGRLLVTTVFRERSRGRLLAGREVLLNSRVRVPANAYLGALMQQTDALSSRGEPAAARVIANKAAGWAQTADVQPGQRWRTLEQLAQLEFQTGALQAAEQHYQSAVDGLSAEPRASAGERSVAFNDLAVLRMLRGNYESVEVLLNEAGSKSAATDGTSGRSLNNLGVLAELRGDRRKAETLYVNALRALSDIPNAASRERAAVEANLARVRSSR